MCVAPEEGKLRDQLILRFNPTPRGGEHFFEPLMPRFIPSRRGTCFSAAYSAVNQKSIPKQTFLSCLFGSDQPFAAGHGGGTGGNLEGPVMRRTRSVSRSCSLLSTVCVPAAIVQLLLDEATRLRPTFLHARARVRGENSGSCPRARPRMATRARARGEFASLPRVLGISLNGCLRLRG